MPKPTAREQFNRQATHYNAEWNAWSEGSLQWLLELAECGAGDRLLDVATGTGFTAMAFAPRVGEVIGADVSEGMLREAQRQAREAGCRNLRFIGAAAEALPFPAESFDLVTCRVAPHHFVSVPKFVGECRRVLRRGGRLLISDTTVPDNAPEVGAWQNRVETLRDGSHMRNYSPAEWTGFVEGAGLLLEQAQTLQEEAPIEMSRWLQKSGCRGEAAVQVRSMFQDPPAGAVQAFSIRELDGGELTFQWLRVALSARKPSA
jgi:ubiquinone/menaquinone biosynthesis C-methylase UbiE